jgi:cation:H+ antiporter
MNFNLLRPLSFFFGQDILHHVGNLTVISLVTAVLYVIGLDLWIVSFVLWTSLITLSSIAIWRAGDFFAPAAEYIQEKRNLPESIKAAVIDAIASSFPEFCVAVIAVLLIGQAEVGVSSIVGSALYNVLVIPAAAGLIAAKPMQVGKDVVWRDGLFYLGVIVLLLAVLFVFPTVWGFLVGAIFLSAYVGYVFLLNRDYQRYQVATAGNVAAAQETKEDEDEDEPEIEIRDENHAWKWVLGMMLVMGAASHILVEGAIHLGDLLGIDAVIMGFVVIAAGTSVPDTVLSVISAKRGNYDAAISNVFGSNIFDVCICLSTPILLALLFTGASTPVHLEQMELVYMLLGATVVALYLFWSDNYTLTRAKCVAMGALYLLIVLMAVAL